MIRILIFILLTNLSISCNRNHKEEQELKSRIERVDELTYRTLDLSDQIKGELFEISKLIWKNFKDKREESAILSVNTNKNLILNFSNKNIQELRSDSNDLWKLDELLWSAIVYKSSSVNSETYNETSFYVIEYNKITGTFYLFIPMEDQDFTTENFNYVDRN